MQKILNGGKNLILKTARGCGEYFKTHKQKCVATAVLLLLVLVLQFLRKFAYVREYVFSRGISRFLLMLLSRFSNLFPFSLSEFALYFAIILGVAFLIKSVLSLKKVDGKRDFSYFLGFLHFLVIATLCIFLLFLTLFTMSYERGSAIPELNLPEVSANAETVASSAKFFAEKTKNLEENFEILDDGSVVSPYTFAELSDMILAEYKQFDNDFFSGFETQPKQLAFGFINSYAGFTGYYSPFYAESNINTYSPTVSIPVTIAHELAHSKGIMRENEANFFAYYILTNSDNEYLQYCGFLVASQIMLSESYDPNNTDIYFDVLASFSEKTILANNHKYYFWQSYDTIFDDIGDWFNNLYLKSSGVASGTKNYGETAHILVRLAEKLQNE